MTSASPNGGAPSNGEPVRSPRIPDAISIPPEILARHRARLLDPATAVRGSDNIRPLSTAYRSDTLLVPAGELESLVPDNDLNNALDELGVELRRPRDENWNGVIGRLPRELGVPVPLVRKPGRAADRAPDPWAALVTLRERLGVDRVAGFGLEHLVMAASLTVEGAPVSNGGMVGGMPVSNGGNVGGGVALYTGNRNPVAMLMRPPVRRPVGELAGHRRPVVAVLDTGIGTHPWWTPEPDPADPIIEVSTEFQTMLALHETGLALANGAEPHPLDDPAEQQDEIQPLLGLTDSHAGHGTFVTGLVHQLCPDAKVLSLRLLHTDGFSTEGSLLLALNWLAERVEAAVDHGQPDKMIDVVSLSLGFYPETAEPSQVQQVATLINRLTAKGVLVVAAAGNDATTRPFLPAAFGRGEGSAAGGIELLAAVGARNAPGITTAAFSNHGDWISRWAPGNALVSTVPMWQGAGGPGLVYPDSLGVGPRMRTAPDPDDLRSGFAVWAGTSFATPVVAGLLADALSRDVAKAGEDGRAKRALEAADAELAGRRWQGPLPAPPL
ncbi:MAG TPA: S8 family serine peptidase [Actinophytocola sp.]|nr:S8 family serine peptidase [Actinophytocola sp.]